MENQVNFGDLIPQVKSMLHAVIRPGGDVSRVHEKVSYTYRIFVITEGRLTLRMNGEEFLCRPGDAVFLCPHQHYLTVFDEPSCTTINLVFEFSEHLSARELPRNLPGFLMYFNGQTENPDYYCPRLDFADLQAFNSSFMISGIPDAVDRIKDMYRLYLADDLFAHLKLNSAALSFISDIAEYATGINSREKNDLANKLLEYIDEHICDRLTREKLAEKFSYHPSYINRLIQSYTGNSLHDYIMRRKTREATRLLTGTDLSMTEIAYRLSFYDSSHFSKVYQTYTKMTPSEVRKKWRKKAPSDHA